LYLKIMIRKIELNQEYNVSRKKIIFLSHRFA